MGLNKVIDRVGTVLLDLSGDTATPRDVASGKTFHDAKGELRMGTATAAEVEPSKYTFIDYDGTVVYSYTDEELDALDALPAGPDHTDENLTFQEWNWTLEELKSWNRERGDRPIVGANYITTDGKSYIFLDLPSGNRKLSFSKVGTLNSVDWGDGTIDTSTSHTYANAGKYTVIIDIDDNTYWYTGTGSNSSTTARQYIKSIRLGKTTRLSSYSFVNLSSLETITMPAGLNIQNTQTFSSCCSLKSMVIPRGNGNNTYLGSSMFEEDYSLVTVSIPPTITKLESSIFRYNRSLKNVILPDSITTLGGNMFWGCSVLKTIIIPNSLTTIPGYFLYECHAFDYIKIPDTVTNIQDSSFTSTYAITLDLSEQTKVISLSTNIGINTSYGALILVPNDLLSAYKTASYWSSYANIIVGV